MIVRNMMGFGGGKLTNLMIEGHSFVDSTKFFPLILNERIKSDCFNDYAISGSLISDLVSRASSVDANIKQGQNNILILWIGTNDLVTIDGTTAYNAFKGYVENRLVAGWKIWTFTITPRGGVTETWNTRKEVFNGLMRTDLSVLDNVQIIDTDTLGLTNYADKFHFSDNIHPAELGAYISVNKLITDLKISYPKIEKDIPNTIPLTLTATGDGSGVASLNIYTSEYTTITLDGDSNFYYDAAGTQYANKACCISPGANRLLYIKTTTGVSNMVIEKDKITKINSWTSATNTPSLGGSISNMSALTILSMVGKSTISGSINNLINLITVSITGGNNTLSGEIYNLINLQSFVCYGNNTLTFTTVRNSTGLSNLLIGSMNTLTSENVNQLLADFWYNKDVSKPITTRAINLSGSVTSGAPTGQGIIDKAALQGYRSPNNDGQYALWTVTTK